MPTTNIRNYIDLLGMFTIGLENGLLEKQAIVRWADIIILQDEQPDYFVIELSLCGHKSVNDIVTLLNEIIGASTPQISGRVILGLLYHRYVDRQLPLKKVVNLLYWLILHGQWSEDEKSFMYELDDWYSLAIDNIYGTEETVEKATLRFIELYKEFRIDNFDKWSEVNRTIDQKIAHLKTIVEEENKALIQGSGKTILKRAWWTFRAK
jgi:hypothetical protein